MPSYRSRSLSAGTGRLTVVGVTLAPAFVPVTATPPETGVSSVMPLNSLTFAVKRTRSPA